MNGKTKINVTILSLGVLIMASLFSFLISYKEKQSPIPQFQNQIAPQVLGESTSIRGEEKAPQSLPEFKPLKELKLEGVSAKSWLIYDSQTGQILSKFNEDEKLPVASLTKLITGLVAYDNLDFSHTLTILQEDLIDVAPVLNLKTGDEIKINDLFDAMIVGSANDAASALANHTELAVGRKFTDLMNEKAAALGMTNTHFGNPMGFDFGKNYSTAADLKLATDASRKLAVFTSLGRRLSKEFSGKLGKTYAINSTNKLIKSHPELEAVKTGYTESSRGSIIVKVKFHGRDVLYIILGSDNRESDFETLESEIQGSYALAF